MCTIGVVKLGGFVLFKTRDPIKTMQFEDYAEKTKGGKISKIMVMNDDGYYGGLNSRGLGIVCSNVNVGQKTYPLLSKEDNFIPGLLDSADAEEAVAKIRKFGKGLVGNIIVADGKDCRIVEVCGKEIAETRVMGGDTRTSHFLKLERGPRNREDYPSSFMRLDRARQLIKNVKTIDDVKNILRDHQNGPSENSICRHGDKRTSSAFIIDTGNRELLYCRGNPCEGEFKSFKV